MHFILDAEAAFSIGEESELLVVKLDSTLSERVVTGLPPRPIRSVYLICRSYLNMVLAEMVESPGWVSCLANSFIVRDIHTFPPMAPFPP